MSSRQDRRDDGSYWDALAQRIAAAALREPRQHNGLEWIAQSRAGRLSAVLVATVGMIVGVFMRAGVPYASSGDEWSAIVAPVDGVGHAMASEPEPPAVSTLMAAQAGRGR